MKKAAGVNKGMYGNEKGKNARIAKSCNVRSVSYAGRMREERKRKQRAKAALGLLGAGATALIITMTSFVTFSRPVLAEELASTTEYYKYYSNFTVQKGDSLWAYACANRNPEGEAVEHYIKEVMFINHLKDDRLVVGQELTLPYYSEEYME